MGCPFSSPSGGKGILRSGYGAPHGHGQQITRRQGPEGCCRCAPDGQRSARIEEGALEGLVGTRPPAAVGGV